MTRLSLLGAALGVLGACGPTPLKLHSCPASAVTESQLTHTVATRHFEVDGSTPREILTNEAQTLAALVDASGLQVAGSKVGHAAATLGEVCFNSSFEQASNGSCRLAAVRIVVHLTFVMPVWKPSTPANASTRSWWSRHEAMSSAHEQGHAAITLEEAKLLYDGLLALPPAPSCEAMKQVVTAAVDAAHDKLNERQRSYDASMPKATED